MVEETCNPGEIVVSFQQISGAHITDTRAVNW